jgi:hypothetical protein
LPVLGHEVYISVKDAGDIRRHVQSIVGALLTESWSPTVSGVWAIAATAWTGGWGLTLFEGKAVPTAKRDLMAG